MLDEAGFPDAVISASNDLDEYLISSLKTQGAAITSWGVGTHLITAKDNPSFGGVYKLAAIKGEDGNFIPKIKLSENSEKVTNPGNKKIYRVYEKASGKIKADLICLENETFTEDKQLLLFDPLEPWKKTLLPAGSFTLREIMVPIFKNGECVYTSPKTMEIRDYCLKEQDTLWDETRRLFNPHEVHVDLSKRLYDTKMKLLDQMSGLDMTNVENEPYAKLKRYRFFNLVAQAHNRLKSLYRFSLAVLLNYLLILMVIRMNCLNSSILCYIELCILYTSSVVYTV